MEKTRPMREKMDGSVFSRQSRHVSFIVNMIKLLFPIFILTFRVNKYVCRQKKGRNRRNESTFVSIIVILLVLTPFCQLTVNDCNLSFILKASLLSIFKLIKKNYRKISLYYCHTFFDKRWQLSEKAKDGSCF